MPHRNSIAIKSIRSLLLIEDNPGDARLLREMFKERGSDDIELTHVQSMSDAETHLAVHAVDMILLDLGLPDCEGLAAVKRTRAAAPHSTLVVLTGMDDEALAVQTLQQGAQDYLIKGQIETRGLIHALRFATERKVMEDALFTVKERAEVTLKCIADAVISTDIAGMVTFLNLGAETLTGWSLSEAAGLPMTDMLQIVDATTRESVPNPMEQAVDQDRTVQLPPNCLLVRRDGADLPIEDRSSPIHDREGHATGAVMVFRDVSGARVTQRQVQALTEELERSNRELQDFATIASHDLQEPLRKIQAFGDRLSERSSGVLDEEAEDYLRRMKTAAGRMQSLINDLLEYSRVTMRPEPPRPVDLGRVVAEVLSDLDERIRISNGQVHVGPMPTIIDNPLQMRQLFQNLIANALKFHPTGVAPDVHVDATARGDGRGAGGRRDRRPVWEIRVRDNGIGFEAKHVERIFAPFQRLNGNQAYEGTGMGLAICRRIVALRGGTITAKSQPGAGATFVVTLPRAADVGGPVPIDDAVTIAENAPIGDAVSSAA